MHNLGLTRSDRQLTHRQTHPHQTVRHAKPDDGPA